MLLSILNQSTLINSIAGSVAGGLACAIPGEHGAFDLAVRALKMLGPILTQSLAKLQVAVPRLLSLTLCATFLKSQNKHIEPTSWHR